MQPPVEQAQQQAGQLTAQAKEQTRSFLDSQRERLADGLDSLAAALRQTSQQFHTQDRDAIAQYTDRAADSVERASSYLRSTDVNEMVSSVEQYARREPALFLGGALALGFLGARFLKSSSSRRGRHAGQHRAGAGYPSQTTEFRGGPDRLGVA